MKRALVVTLALLTPLAVVRTAAAAGDGALVNALVRFPTVEPIPGASAVPPGEVTGLLDKPAGAGPFPAVVLLHGCAGLYDLHREWARALVAEGFVALRVDSFSPRGITEICTDIRRPVPRKADTLGALAYLERQPWVDGERLAVMGWSHGAGVALALDRDYALPARYRQRLRAVVALYPWCPSGRARFVAPVLILIGAADDWTPAERCRDLAAGATAAGRPIALTVYPGATHSFDCATCDGRYWGHRLVHDPAAAADARARVATFLGERLRP